MPAVWKLNGTPFADLGLSGLKRELRSLAPDLVTFIADGLAFDGADISGLALNDVVTITVTVDATETQWFKGIVTAVPREGAPNGEAMRYTVTGPWWYLDNLVYRQRFPLNAGANPSIYLPEYHRRAVAVIGQDYLGARQTNTAALADVLDWCIAAGAGFTRDTLPDGFNIPYISAIAPVCSEAARMCLKMMPDAASRFDYTATTPVLSVVRRGDADDTTVDLSTETGLSSISINPRPDLKIDHVVIQNISINGNFYTVLTEDVDPVGSTGLEFGSVVVPIDANTDPIPAGLAANWRSSLSTLQYEGRIVFEEEDCLRTVRPGDVVNVTNGLTAWATMNAQVMQVNEDVDAGRTEWVFGPPAHLSVQDLIQVLRVARLQRNAYDGPPLVAGRRKPDESGVEFGGPQGEFSAGHFDGDVYIEGGLTVDSDVYGPAAHFESLEVNNDIIAGGATIAGWDVDATFQDHEDRIAALENRADVLEGRATDLEDRADALEDRATDLEDRATALEGDLAALSATVDTNYSTLSAVDDAIIADVETAVDAINALGAITDDHEDRIAALEAAVVAAQSDASNALAQLAAFGTESLLTCDGYVDVVTP